MKTIRMITFHTPKNYGAVLQAYGLQTCLSGFSNDTEIIDYDTEHLRSLYPVFPKPNSLKSFLAFLLFLPHYFAVKKKFSKFESFKKTKLHLTKRYKTTQELFDENWKSDCYFCTGSDQVFNPKRIPDERKAFYLSFVPSHSKRFSYAASFGVGSIPVEREEEIKNFIAQFNNISVRERSGAHLIKALTGKDVPIVLDPVFLCSKKQWESIIAQYRKPFKKFVLYYRILNNRNSDAFARKFADEKGLKLIVVTQGLLRIHCDAVLYDVGPEEFLGLIRDADYVVTDAFHGVAFSVIFQKQFVFSDTGATNNRGIELLQLLGIQEQCYSQTYKSEARVDYDQISPVIEKHIALSLDYLRRALDQ